MAISIIQENILACIAPGHNVVDGTGKLESEGACHAATLRAGDYKEKN